MDQQDPRSFVPDAYDRAGQRTKADFITPLRSRWKVPAAVGTMAVVTALCLSTGVGPHTAAAAAVAKPATVAAHSAINSGVSSSLKGHIETAADAPAAGVHGAFNLYDGVGGGVEFWFSPTTGQLTISVGAGVGAGGGGVLGTYAPGSVPEAGTYVYATADLGTGTVANFNVLGSYSLDNGKLVGQVSGTVEGRTVTIGSDGSTTFDVSVVAAPGAEDFYAATGVNHVFSFNIVDVINYIWNAITDLFTGQYSLTDNDATGDDTVAYSDDSSTSDGSELTTSDDSSSTDASSDDAADDSSDGGDGGGGGGGGGGGCAINTTILPDKASSTQSSTTVTPLVDDDDDTSHDVC